MNNNFPDIELYFNDIFTSYFFINEKLELIFYAHKLCNKDNPFSGDNLLKINSYFNINSIQFFDSKIPCNEILQINSAELQMFKNSLVKISYKINFDFEKMQIKNVTLLTIERIIID